MNYLSNIILAPALLGASLAAFADEYPSGFLGLSDISVLTDSNSFLTFNPEEAIAAVSGEEAIAAVSGEEELVVPEVAADPEVVVAAAEGGSQGPTLLESIASVMRPEAQVPPLDNDRLTFYLSDEVLFGQFERNAARYDFENARINLGFLFAEEQDIVFQGGLALDAPSELVSSIRLSFGVRLYGILLDEENNDSFAGAVGVEAAYTLPFSGFPLEIAGSFYYAPDVFTFGEGDRAVDAQIDLIFPFRPQLSLFIGGRFLQLDTTPGDAEIDNRVHVGFRWDIL